MVFSYDSYINIIIKLIEVGSVILFSGVIAYALKRALTRGEHIIIKTFNLSKSHFRFFKHFTRCFVYFIGIIIAISMIPSLKSLAYSLLASSGIFALIIGFASQQAFSNIMSGLLLGIFEPFTLGDKIKVNEISGTVEDITLRHTIIRTAANIRVLIPNSLMNTAIIENASHHKGMSTILEIPISHSACVEKALAIFQEELESHTHKQSKPQQKHPVEVAVAKLDIEAVYLKGAVWVNNEAQGQQVSSNIYRTVKRRFEKEGIGFPNSSKLQVVAQNSSRKLPISVGPDIK